MKKLLCLFAFLPAFACAQAVFGPGPGGPVTLNVSTSTNSVAVPNSNFENQIRVYNSCTTTVFVKSGSSTVTASNTDMAIAPGAVEVFSMSASHTHMAAIVPSGTCDIYIARGTGL